MKPAALLGHDIVGVCIHGCLLCAHPVAGKIIEGTSEKTKINFIGAALAMKSGGVHAACCGANRFKNIEGSKTVFIENKPAVRIGDAVVTCGGVGKVTTGSSNVFIGG